MSGLVREFLASFAFAATTRETYGRVLGELVARDWQHFTAADLLAFIERPEWGSSHRYVCLTACRRFIAWACGPGHPALSARVRRFRSKPQRVLTPERALALLASFDTSSPKGARDLALAALALDTGLRCAELCRLAVSDVYLERRTLQVIIKGGQWGLGVFSEETALYIDRWLSMRRGSAPTVFVSTKTWEPLTREGLKVVVRKWGEVLGFKMSPHDLRRSFATLATVMGAPTRVVQKAGRWSDIGMVELYTRGLEDSAIIPYLPVARLLGG